MKTYLIKMYYNDGVIIDAETEEDAVKKFIANIKDGDLGEDEFVAKEVKP